MDLRDAELGDQYRVFIDDKGMLSTEPGMLTMVTTIIAIKKPSQGKGVILGWKATQEKPKNALPRHTTSNLNDYILDEKQYTHGIAMALDLSVAVKIVNGLDGFSCTKCSNFYPYALPNQANGTLICWSCRNGR